MRLTPAQSSLILLLTRAFPGVVTWEEISKALCGYVPERQTSAIRTLVSRLRRACSLAFGDQLIETVCGEGYRLRVEVAIRAMGRVTEK